VSALRSSDTGCSLCNDSVGLVLAIGFSCGGKLFSDSEGSTLFSGWSLVSFCVELSCCSDELIIVSFSVEEVRVP